MECGDSKIEFKNGRLHVYPEDLSKIPPPLLEKFGIDFIPPRSKDIFPCGDHSESLQDQISYLEAKLAQAKQENRKPEIDQLEEEIKKLKKQQEGNSSAEKPSKDSQNDTKY